MDDLETNREFIQFLKDSRLVNEEAYENLIKIHKDKTIDKSTTSASLQTKVILRNEKDNSLMAHVEISPTAVDIFPSENIKLKVDYISYRSGTYPTFGTFGDNLEMNELEYHLYSIDDSGWIKRIEICNYQTKQTLDYILNSAKEIFEQVLLEQNSEQ